MFRGVYQYYHKHIRAACVDGMALEIGCGSGHFRDIASNTISIYIQFLPWPDAGADAHNLPFENATFDNIILLDVLHHLSHPKQLAERILKPGGHIALIELAMTCVSSTIFPLFHEGPVNLIRSSF